ncbi:MAG TPA: hypothetical protein VK003_03355 [Oceanobacillus sp.]|nr:hypothetical protein [Oceanobacillus sp.]
MSNAFEKLRKQVLTEVQKERARQQSGEIDRAQLLGTFLQACLGNLGYSRDDFAQKLDVEPEFADALLEGLLPASEINDSLLEDIASAIDYEPNLLKILLGRTVSTSVSPSANAANKRG